jgi:membrane protein
MTWTTAAPVQKLRDRWPMANIAVETLDGWRRHQSSRNAAVLAYYGFLSVFPLVMVASAVLNVVLRNDPDLRDRILESAFSEVPVIGDQIRDQVGTIGGDIAAITIGVVIALWAATRAFNALQVAFDDVWEVPVDDRDNVALRRLKAVAGGFAIGSALVITGALTNLTGGGPLGYWALNIAALGVNMAVLTTMMRYLTAATLTTSMVWRGALLSAFGLLGLHLLGGFIVRRYLASASDTAGTFATVIALTAWINLLAIVSLLGAELNSARHRHRNGDTAIDTVSMGTVTR